MKIKKINHIGIATSNLEKTLKLYEEVFGLKSTGIQDIPIQMQRSAFISIGESALEVMEPTDPQGPVGKFIGKHGEGLHHISLEVDDVNALSEELKKRDIKLMLPEAVNFAGIKINFVHPKSMVGVLIELIQEGGNKQ